jgi:hypothetical protein
LQLATELDLVRAARDRDDAAERAMRKIHRSVRETSDATAQRRVLQSWKRQPTPGDSTMSVTSEGTTFERVLDLLSDGEWHTKAELAEITRYPQHWVRELGESGYELQLSAEGQVRLDVGTRRLTQGGARSASQAPG